MNTLTDILQHESARLHQAADKHTELMRIGKGAADALRGMVAALLVARASGKEISADEAEQRIHEDALSVEVRSDWIEPRSKRNGDCGEPVEFRILLSTGGPATRIIGELQNGEPTSARLEVQDWGTPWTEYKGDEVSESVLLDYCRCFYFGEG